MKYVSFIRPDGRPSFGRLDGTRIIDLGAADVVPGKSSSLHSRPADLKAAIVSGALTRLHSDSSYAFDEVVLLPVVPQPGKILCVGLNYETHRRETGRAEAEHPAIFTRFADTLVAHGQPIVLPKASSQLDYEGELAIVIGRAGRAISRDRALEHIAGYSCFNDASLRDWQRHNIQFTPGKNFPGTGAFGPWLVTPDEVGDLEAQHVVTRLNSQVVQDQAIAEMIWPIAELIAYISVFTPLAPGDVIATGTPGGVGAKRNPPLWMKSGDKVEIHIGTVGTLVNRIINED
jgi:2-keto-4-pentenoate hydratase/2-oxohepta-3-ene-1,7-dioic acid hydratase in catechol pathway